MTVRALEMVKDGMAHNDLHAIGEAASLSAAAHQRLLFKPDLEAFQELGTAIGASGCCIGHSGTLLGLLVDPTTVDVQAAFDWLSARWHHPLRQVTLIDGGVRVVRSATLPV